MPTVRVSLFEGRPILNIASYARRGSSRRDRLSPAEVAQIARTVRRVPEAVVKVLPRASNNFTAVSRHLDYIGRKGELELETDDGDQLSGKGIGRELLEDWDLDLDEHRRQVDLGAALGRAPPKLVHKLMFSMPPGTPAEAVLAAARNFLREEFALKHRYAFVLHTDEPHPHVHAVVKAVSEQGVRLNIRKATLRQWRFEFARHLRMLGVPANATERAVRGEGRKALKDGIYRASLRGESTHVRARAEASAAEFARNPASVRAESAVILKTRKAVEAGWQAVSDALQRDGHAELAAQIGPFIDRLEAPRSDRERVRVALLERANALRARHEPRSR